MKVKMKQELYAFWPYDLFPYFLGGRVTKFFGQQVEVEGYGKGYLFTPVKIIEGKDGKHVLEELEKLKQQYQTRLVLLKEELTSKVTALGLPK